MRVSPRVPPLAARFSARGRRSGPTRIAMLLVWSAFVVFPPINAAGGGSGAVGVGASTLGVGLLLTLMRDLHLRNEELDRARAELARTAGRPSASASRGTCTTCSVTACR